jgi:hypothetical protein
MSGLPVGDSNKLLRWLRELEELRRGLTARRACAPTALCGELAMSSATLRIPRDVELPGRAATVRKEGARLIVEPVAGPSLLDRQAGIPGGLPHRSFVANGIWRPRSWKSSTGLPTDLSRKFQPVVVANVAATSGSRMPARSFPSRSTCLCTISTAIRSSEPEGGSAMRPCASSCRSKTTQSGTLSQSSWAE